MRRGTDAAQSARGPVLWQYGFRPFYLLASLFACVSLLLWVAQYAGILPMPYLAGPLWHGHEMLFGFATAVIAGFLLTAVATWTQQPPLRGAPLVALALLWLSARALVLMPFPAAATAANTLFPLMVAAAVAVPLIRTRNRRNLVFIGLLALLGLLAAVMHLALSGIFAPSMYATGVQLSGLAWSIAFGLYAATYWPVLTRPRIDGRPG